MGDNRIGVVSSSDHRTVAISTKMAAKRVCVGDTLVEAPSLSQSSYPYFVTSVETYPSGAIRIGFSGDRYYRSEPNAIVEIIEG